MVNKHEKLEELICNAEAILNPQKWLAEEATNLALRIPGLDEVPPQAMLPLAKLVVHGEADSAKLSMALDIGQGKIDEYLDKLFEFKFIEKTWGGYKATQTGEEAFETVAEQMVAREVFQLKARLKQLETLQAMLN